MIKCEVVFSADNMSVNGWYIIEKGDKWSIYKTGEELEFEWLEQAIKYCMEN